jgi:hypothetical protein
MTKLDSETNRPMTEKERLELLNNLIRERYGDWATRKDIPIQDNHEASR